MYRLLRPGSVTLPLYFGRWVTLCQDTLLDDAGQVLLDCMPTLQVDGREAVGHGEVSAHAIFEAWAGSEKHMQVGGAWISNGM